MRAVFDLFTIAPDDVTLPALGAVWSSVLTGADFSIYLAGRTGSGKSVLTALFLSLFGSGFDFNELPASWPSTGNSLESLAHAAKDCVLAVDDFCPHGSAADRARLQSAADRIFRAQGNHSGRLRCRTDGTVKAVKPPRGLIISTGEDISQVKQAVTPVLGLNEAGLLASIDTARSTNKVRRTIAGKSQSVIHLQANSFAG